MIYIPLLYFQQMMKIYLATLSGFGGPVHLYELDDHDVQHNGALGVLRRLLPGLPLSLAQAQVSAPGEGGRVQLRAPPRPARLPGRGWSISPTYY